jgi:hypothetical protein
VRFELLGTGQHDRWWAGLAQVFGSQREHRDDLEEIVDVDR